MGVGKSQEKKDVFKTIKIMKKANWSFQFKVLFWESGNGTLSCTFILNKLLLMEVYFIYRIVFRTLSSLSLTR